MGIKEILNLSVSERIFMVEAIWDSIISDPKSQNLALSDSTKKELDIRLAEHQKNPTLGSSWEEVKSRLLNQK